MINHEQTLKLIKKAKNGDERAKEQLVINNSPLIKSIINRFKGKGIDYDDLYQIACIGFLKSIKNFDENFNVKFSTYSVPMIIGEIKRYIRDNGAIKVSRSLKILANKINKFIDSYLSEQGNSPTIEHIAKVFDITSEEVTLALDSAKMPLSIYEKFDDEDDAPILIDKLTCGDTEDNLVDKIHLRSMIHALSEREKKIVVLRYFRDKTQGEVAKCLGVSQVQISRLENKILNKLRLKF